MNYILSLQLILFLFAATQSHARLEGIQLLEPVTIENIGSWWDRVHLNEQEYLESQEVIIPAQEWTKLICREASDVRNTVVCYTTELTNMNLAFGRISAFVEGYSFFQAGVLPEWNDENAEPLLYTAGGHDLKLSDVKRFYDQVSIECPASRGSCLNAEETQLYERLVAPLLNQNNTSSDYVIIVGHGTRGGTYRSILSHEIIHAHFFQYPEFAQVVNDFWIANNQVPGFREYVNHELGNIYDVTNETLMMNEVAAFSLGYPTSGEWLAARRSEFGGDLLARLQANGVSLHLPWPRP